MDLVSSLIWNENIGISKQVILILITSSELFMLVIF